MDFAAGNGRLKPAYAAARPVSVAIGDLAVLLGAVRDQLHLASTAAVVVEPRPYAYAHDQVSMLRVTLADCVAALDLLHANLGQQESRLRELECDDALVREGGA